MPRKRDAILNCISLYLLTAAAPQQPKKDDAHAKSANPNPNPNARGSGKSSNSKSPAASPKVATTGGLIDPPTMVLAPEEQASPEWQQAAAKRRPRTASQLGHANAPVRNLIFDVFIDLAISC